ncbi:MAG TPA: LptA/OstA family protein [Candidatus Polarisedimenticolaceae bacterium]|nr:LptA/OstA family protein [Candidatus Polarisedimenticolaceae bacterium]
MHRLRLLRLLVLLAAVLVTLPVVYYLVRGGRTAAPVGPPRNPSPHTTAQKIEFTDLLGGRRRGTIEAQMVEQRPDGTFHLRGIDRLVIERDNAPPLVLRAQSGVVSGKPGTRTMHVQGGIELKDDATGMSARVEALDWVEEAGEVRSQGAVALSSPEMTGSAAAFVYGVRGQPSTLERPQLRTAGGQTVTAAMAVLHDGTRDVELRGEVRLRGAEGALDAAALRLLRPAPPAGQRARGSGGVSGTAVLGPGGARRFRADAVDLDWEPGGEIVHAQLRGKAELQQEQTTLLADWIDAARTAGAPAEWEVAARGGVRATAAGASGTSRLRGEEVRAHVAGRSVTRADASGGVQVEGPQGSAEGDVMELRGEVGARVLRVAVAGGARKAALSTGRARVAGDTIVVQEGTGTTVAEGRVEATLLPDPAATSARRTTTPFRADAPVHFVADRLEATEKGDHLLFTGSVRGWQGERSLAAARVEMDQSAQTLSARGSVVSRLPRAQIASVSEGDYVQVTADALDYAGAESTAGYRGDVRLRQREGWLQAQRLDAALLPGGGLKEALASQDVSFEYRHRRADGTEELARGKADRGQYLPGESSVRLFGDHAPATVRKEGTQGGTTEGRVLRYVLDSGVLEVESGARDRGRIETSGT